MQCCCFLFIYLFLKLGCIFGLFLWVFFHPLIYIAVGISCLLLKLVPVSPTPPQLCSVTDISAALSKQHMLCQTAPSPLSTALNYNTSALSALVRTLPSSAAELLLQAVGRPCVVLGLRPWQAAGRWKSCPAW